MNKKVRQLGGIYSVIAGMTLAGLAPQAPVRAEAEVATGGAINQPSDTAEPAVTPTPTVTPTQTPAASDQKKDNWTVKLKKCSHPKKITKGAGFKVKGTLKASKKMKTVKASILDEEGDSVCTKKIKVNKKNCSLAKVDKSMKFGKLKEGSYSYVVEATNTSRNKKTVIDDDFTVKKGKWTSPVKGGNWGDGWHCRCSTHGGRHYGWDARGGGRTIYSVADGTVVYAKYHAASSKASFGKLIIVYHGNGIYSYYAHCSSFKVKVGDKVIAGDKIGITGSTGYAFGSHLHFEMRKGPAFSGSYNGYELLDKYTYRQFNPGTKIKR